MELAFPPSWGGLAARILETGVDYKFNSTSWMPRVSSIPYTVKTSKRNQVENDLASVFFRVHDCIHQLWGVPWHSNDRSYYKRVQMAGEVAVLGLTEFYFGGLLWDTCPELRELIEARGAVPIFQNFLRKDIESAVIRIDLWLHRMVDPENPTQGHIDWIKDYRQMLNDDRDYIDQNWELMTSLSWKPTGAPTCPIPQHLDGMEVSLWMVRDFLHQLKTTPLVDQGLVEFNRSRRNKIILPKGFI